MEKYLAKIENHIFNNQNSKLKSQNVSFCRKTKCGLKIVLQWSTNFLSQCFCKRYVNYLCPCQTLLTSFHQLTFLPSLSYTTSDNMLLWIYQVEWLLVRLRYSVILKFKMSFGQLRLVPLSHNSLCFWVLGLIFNGPLLPFFPIILQQKKKK